MFLKRLTMKGFKSFADNTVLEFEPGVTAVVGPNGSGKSNVVDAVTWVLGAQSTRALRSARMDDVIFMGTANRAALGRAEVALTIDNSSGRLAIDGAEVTISRTLFRSGDSEYAINGTTCRLLDVQELLGDSGVGRQQHMIIGQGQLDSILSSNPENRRAVIEEAAGVLKHRRRKERSERRLGATQENLERLGDLVREVRRQMRPLERQAVSARSYSEVESELRDARHALFATRLNNFELRRRELELSLEEASVRERELRHELVTLDAKASAAAAEMASRREEMLASTLGTLQGLAERARGTSSIIQERERSLRQALIASADENVIATLEADAAKLVEDLEGLNSDEFSLNALRETLSVSRQLFSDAEEAFELSWASSSSESDEAALNAAREQIALLERSLASLQESERRASHRLADAHQRSAAVTAAKEKAVHEKARVEASLKDAAIEFTQAEGDVEHAQNVRRGAEESFQTGADVASRAHARAETLARALDELSGAGGRAIIGNLEGVLGSFLDLIEVDAGSERAVESAAGASVGAMVVDGRRSARAALAALRKEGGAGLILPVAEGDVATLATPHDTRAVRSLVRARSGAPAHVDRVLDALFARAFVASDWESGFEVALANPDLVIVTEDGDRFASSGWRVSSGRAVVTRLTVEEAESASKEAARELENLRHVRDEAEMSLGDTLERLNVATATLASARNEDARLHSELERLSTESDELVGTIDTLSADVADLAEQILTLDADLLSQREQLPVLEQALADGAEREDRRSEAKNSLESQRRSVDEEATLLSRREAEFAERRRLIEQRRGEIEARLEGRSGERLEAATRRQSLEFDREVLTRLAGLVDRAAEEIHVAQEAMDSTYREQLEATRASAELLEEVRQSRHGADARLSELGEVMRRHEIEQAELAVKVANVHDVIRRDLAVEPHEMGPAPLIELAEGVSLETRVGDLEARITSLGPINPLALEELAMLEDRYKDLDAQVSDVRHARRELQEVVRALDEEIMQTFTKAFADVNEHFSSLIAMLFPGGQGRLNMSESDDPLNTGVEIEVRPMGRNVRRISLLSGGERSMAALAFLFAVFRSRPSPFYLMDEVEAALDDVNLQRFLSLVDEFRDEAQLLIVTHQKRTMEAADALYGVTMVPGASSKVVSQRVNRTREVETA
ncbi:MAG TPA: chromosome segregation protein SMC [Acidimicrobiales bacterium]